MSTRSSGRGPRGGEVAEKALLDGQAPQGKGQIMTEVNGGVMVSLWLGRV